MDRDEEEDDYTELSARPLTPARPQPDRSPDAIFRSFVANAYEESALDAPAQRLDLDLESDREMPTRTGRKPLRPVPSVNASLRNTEQWASSVEELLDADEPSPNDQQTRVAGVPAPKRPVADLADDDGGRDTEPPPAYALGGDDVSYDDPSEVDYEPPSIETPAEPLRRPEVLEALQRNAHKPAPPEEGTVRVVLLTKKKPGVDRPPSTLDWDAIDRGAVRVPPDASSLTGAIEHPEWQSVVRAPSTTTQKREALKLVPDVAMVEGPSAPLSEGSEDGMMPGGELDRKLGDMSVLLRYGHQEQVRRELDHLIAEFPRDLLLLRRISEFWVGNQRVQPACDVLFTLASGLFERRNVEGMRQALEQVLVLSPGNERATRLLTLLAERPSNR